MKVPKHGVRPSWPAVPLERVFFYPSVATEGLLALMEEKGRRVPVLGNGSSRPWSIPPPP